MLLGHCHSPCLDGDVAEISESTVLLFRLHLQAAPAADQQYSTCGQDETPYLLIYNARR